MAKVSFFGKIPLLWGRGETGGEGNRLGGISSRLYGTWGGLPMVGEVLGGDRVTPHMCFLIGSLQGDTGLLWFRRYA